MTAADHEQWAQDYDAGSRPWEREVAGWVRHGAWSHHHRGDTNTRLFAEPNTSSDVVGFLSISVSLLALDGLLSQAIGLTKGSRPKRDPVPATNIVYFGVPKDKQGQRYGTRILADLFDGLVEDFVSPRFVRLDVWTMSPAMELYQRLGFVTLGDPLPGTFAFGVDQPGFLQGMVSDRFSPNV